MNGENVVVDDSDFVLAMARFVPSLDRATARAALDSASSVADRARSSVPRRSGRLAASIRAEVGVGEVDALAAMGEGVPYAGWIEFGGSRGRPYVADGRYMGAATRTAELEFARSCERAADTEARRV